jgi:hypothetical protein
MKRGLLLVIAALGTSAFAQDLPAVISITRETIKEGRSAAHEKVEMDYARAFRKANFPYHYLALEAMTGTGEVWFLTAYPSFEAVEKGFKEVTKPPMKGEMDLLDARDGELRAGSRNMYAVLRPDLSYHPELGSVGKTRYVMVLSYRVRLGKMSSFAEGSKMVLAAYEKAKSKQPLIAYEVIAGVPEGLFLFIMPMESLKSMDEYPERQKAFTEAMGMDNFRNLERGMGEVFASTEASLFSVNPRMSYVAKETEDVDPAFWRPKPPAAKPAADTKTKETKEKTGQ